MVLRFTFKSKIWNEHFTYMGVYEGTNNGQFMLVNSNRGVEHYFDVEPDSVTDYRKYFEEVNTEPITIDLNI